MISVSRFIHTIDNILLNRLQLTSFGFRPSWSTKIENFIEMSANVKFGEATGDCIWWHEEPLIHNDLEDFEFRFIPRPEKYYSTTILTNNNYTTSTGSPGMFNFTNDTNFIIFANSEKSQLKKDFLKRYPAADWYFFFHGFAALDWYRDFKYLNYQDTKIDKVFSSFNHIIQNNRSYRMYFISLLKEHNIYDQGYISLPLLTPNIIKQELFKNQSPLSLDAKKHIVTNLLPSAQPVRLDECDYNSASADVSMYLQRAFWNIVTETVYFDEKLHLTEKIFKPIVSRRPFILVAAPGNLAYLKSYGFKTFDRWIDESYDNERDPDRRMQLIVAEMKKLCSLSHTQLLAMHQEMQDVLEYNHQHFYTNFKTLIVNELVDNFEICVKQYNLGISDRFQFRLHNVNLDQVKTLLLQ